MTRTLWIHGGTLKTGTTRIQNLAWSQRADLLEQGWLYPETGAVLDEPEVGMRHSQLVYGFRDRPAWDAQVSELVAEIGRSSATHVLLSSEAWSRPGFVDSLAPLVAELRAAGVVGEAFGVVYVRNRASYARALYREFTRRRGNRLPFPEYVAAAWRPLDPLVAVTGLAGAVDSLEVYPAEEAGDTAAHFFGRLDVRMALGEQQQRVNQGVGPVRAEALRQLNLIAPELASSYPGPSEEPAGYSERLRPGQLTADDQWRADFSAVSGWTEDQLARLLGEDVSEADRDVAELAGPLHGEVMAWLRAAATPVVQVETFPQTQVQEFTVKEVDPLADSPWLSGTLLLRRGERGWGLLGVDDFREREVPSDRASSGLARRFPGRPEAAHGRWGTPHLEYGLRGRLDLQLVHEDGRRLLLATIRRTWQLDA